MNNYVYSIQRAAHRVGVPDVPVPELCFWIQIGGVSIAMDLRKQRIQNPDLMSMSE